MVALLSTVLSLPPDERAEVERALVPVARRAAAGALTAAIAHDAGNALFGLVGLLDLIVPDEPVDADRKELLVRAADELNDALTPLLRFLRAGDDDGVAADFAAATEAALVLYRHGGRSPAGPGDAVVSRVACPPSLTTQAVVHLLLACDPVERIELASGEGGSGELRVAPARELSLDEVVAARIAADRGGSVGREDETLVLRLPTA